ncbi:MAG TPA: hypothetical protein VHD87_01165 [Acidimicrobiales bacterium]|nr:hypothetical protein [Acidimicrobiales bacterium]
MLDDYRAQLRARGVCVIPGFVPDDEIAAMVEECDALAAGAYHQDVQGTPYLELPSDDWPADHPRATWTRSAVHTLGYDQFPAASRIRRLYEDDAFLSFLSDVLERRPLYRYADPIGALNVAVMTEGDVLGWHYDQTDFVVSLAIQSSERGGDFENVAHLRRADGDEDYATVAAILRGDGRDRVVVEPMTPGTLMIFEGRRSLHRVTPIEGDRPRYVALFGYDTKPDTMSSDLLKQIRYGRTEPLRATG